MKAIWYLSVLCVLGSVNHALAAPTKVCVSVEPKQWVREAEVEPKGGVQASPSDLTVPSGAESAPIAVPVVVGELPTDQRKVAFLRPPQVPTPMGIDPELYLQRLLAYQVTHHVRYEAVETGCKEKLVVELYALDSGWTVFARFSEHAREEKVDRVQIDEFGPLADRLTRALLDDRGVQETLDRENVLRVDSEEDLRRIQSQRHFALSMGTALRIGKLPTAVGSQDRIESRTRLISPLALTIGSRNKFRQFALDPFARVQLGTQERVPMSDKGPGGHVDFSGSGALGLHFLRYASARGIGSPYFGGGAQFELARYKVTEAGTRGRAGSTDSFMTGGLSADLLLGYEFMRASSLHFFVQLDASLPAYAVDARTKSGGANNTYVPSLVAQAGLLL